MQLARKVCEGHQPGAQEFELECGSGLFRRYSSLGRNFEGHLANLRAVLVRFREYRLKLKPKKCELFQKEVNFLGRVVGPRGMHIGPGYVRHRELPKA